MRFSGMPPAETPQPIKMKFCTIDYVGELTRCAKNCCNRLAGGGPTDRWNITSTFVPYLTLPYFTLPFFFLYASTAQTAQPIYTHDSSNDVVCCKEVPFGGHVDTKTHSGVKTPKNPKFWNRGAKFPAKSIHSNNVWTVWDRRKISTDSLYKVGVGESNGDVISALGRHLMPKTTSGSILKLKIANNLSTVRDRRKMSM